MASKRMFSKKIVESDAFLDMSLTAKALYFHLNMIADDDGFVGNAKRQAAYIGASVNDLDELVRNRFVLSVDNVYVIKHWRIHNTIIRDRHTPTTYQDEFQKLTIKDNKSYTERKHFDNKADTVFDENTTDNSLETNVKQNDNADIDIDLDLDTDKDINNNSCASELHDTEPDTEPDESLEGFYESIWELYPIKKGKGAVSKTKKKVLQRIGYEQIKRCVERFISDMGSQRREMRFWMHGSTFFNSGYVDYLDENWEKEHPKPPDKEPDSQDRFSALEDDFRRELEESRVIEGQSLNLGDATAEQVERLQKAGVL